MGQDGTSTLDDNIKYFRERFFVEHKCNDLFCFGDYRCTCGSVESKQETNKVIMNNNSACLGVGPSPTAKTEKDQFMYEVHSVPILLLDKIMADLETKEFMNDYGDSEKVLVNPICNYGEDDNGNVHIHLNSFVEYLNGLRDWHTKQREQYTTKEK